jgi:hypothetical protein
VIRDACITWCSALQLSKITVVPDPGDVKIDPMQKRVLRMALRVRGRDRTKLVVGTTVGMCDMCLDRKTLLGRGLPRAIDGRNRQRCFCCGANPGCDECGATREDAPLRSCSQHWHCVSLDGRYLCSLCANDAGWVCCAGCDQRLCGPCHAALSCECTRHCMLVVMILFVYRQEVWYPRLREVFVRVRLHLHSLWRLHMLVQWF